MHCGGKMFSRNKISKNERQKNIGPIFQKLKFAPTIFTFQQTLFPVILSMIDLVHNFWYTEFVSICAQFPVSYFTFLTTFKSNNYKRGNRLVGGTNQERITFRK